jgi:hypothetical protein
MGSLICGSPDSHYAAMVPFPTMSPCEGPGCWSNDFMRLDAPTNTASIFVAKEFTSLSTLAAVASVPKEFCPVERDPRLNQIFRQGKKEYLYTID